MKGLNLNTYLKVSMLVSAFSFTSINNLSGSFALQESDFSTMDPYARPFVPKPFIEDKSIAITETKAKIKSYFVTLQRKIEVTLKTSPNNRYANLLRNMLYINKFTYNGKTLYENIINGFEQNNYNDLITLLDIGYKETRAPNKFLYSRSVKRYVVYEYIDKIWYEVSKLFCLYLIDKNTTFYKLSSYFNMDNIHWIIPEAILQKQPVTKERFHEIRENPLHIFTINNFINQ